MNKAGRLIKGGLLIGVCAIGLFLLSGRSLQAALSAQSIRDTVERYAHEQYGDDERPFFIDPIVLEVQSGDIAPAGKPLIIGLAPNHTTLRIFIDDILVDTVSVAETDGRVAIFAYQPRWLLAQATHTVHVQALNQHGDESKLSSRLYFKIDQTRLPQISATRVTADGNETSAPSAEDFVPLIDVSGKGEAEVTRDNDEQLLLFLLVLVIAGWGWREARWLRTRNTRQLTPDN